MFKTSRRLILFPLFFGADFVLSCCIASLKALGRPRHPVLLAIRRTSPADHRFYREEFWQRDLRVVSGLSISHSENAIPDHEYFPLLPMLFTSRIPHAASKARYRRILQSYRVFAALAPSTGGVTRPARPAVLMGLILRDDPDDYKRL